MIVEFYGLPCSGKSTSVRELLQQCEQSVDIMKYCKEIKKSKILRYVFTIEFIKFFFLLIPLFLKKKHKQKYDIKVLYFFCCIYLRYMFCRHNSTYSIYFNDHGAVQNIVSALWDDEKSTKYGEKITYYFCSHFKNELLFVYTDNPDNKKLFSAVKQRGNRIRLYFLPQNEAYRVMDSQRHIMETMTSTVEKYSPYIKVSTLCSKDKSVAEILDFITKNVQQVE